MQGGRRMPTVTITMNEKAYEIYRTLDKGTRSRQMSAALLEWYHRNVLKEWDEK